MTASEDDQRYWPVSDDTMARVQFYDCKTCRALVIDRAAHTAWHDLNNMAWFH